MEQASPKSADSKQPKHPFRVAVWRGLGVVMPPLLTLVVFIWVLSAVDGYVLQPVELLARKIIVGQMMYKVQDTIPPNVRPQPMHGRRMFVHDGEHYVQLESGKWIPKPIYDYVEKLSEVNLRTATAREVYDHYVLNYYLQRYRTIPVFFVLFILILYLLGKFLAAGIGRFFFGLFEQLVQKLPFVRAIYSAAKQVTDFVFKEQEVEFTRVVALQYPRKGIWSMGFVTGESFLDIRSAANEPMLSVLMPTSPMPATGFTITVPKSETIDLDITVDQAVQFCVSCGVVVPAHQQCGKLELEQTITAALEQKNGEKTAGESPSAAPTPSNEQADGDS